MLSLSHTRTVSLVLSLPPSLSPSLSLSLSLLLSPSLPLSPHFFYNRHPYTVAFHLLFRTGAVLSYLLCTFFSSSFVLNFIVIVLLLSFDFWTVKNVSGRLLVGLRWWNEIDETTGNSKWVFESRRENKPQPAESRVFWWSLYGFTAVWIVFIFTSLIRLALQYLIIACVATALNVANLVGYTRCQKDAGTRLRQAATRVVGQALLQGAVNRVFGGGSGTAAAAP